MDEIASPQQMRQVLGSFATGVVVVTGDDGGTPVGFTCQSFASVSLDPPLVLFCAAHTSLSWPRIRESRRFAVNVLAGDQQAVGISFAVSGADKFATVGWQPTPWGPCIDGSLASVLCDVDDVYRAGDHDIVVGRVRRLVMHREIGPLVFFRGAFGLATEVSGRATS